MDYENPWLLNEQIFISEMISDHIGFVYKITNLDSGRFYIGKKLFTRAGRKQVKGKKDVQKLGIHKFRREILRLCKSKSECTYYEAKYQFDLSVLMENTYNKWIQCKIRRNTKIL
jgi:hypothetical protein